MGVTDLVLDGATAAEPISFAASIRDAGSCWTQRLMYAQELLIGSNRLLRQAQHAIRRIGLGDGRATAPALDAVNAIVAARVAVLNAIGAGAMSDAIKAGAHLDALEASGVSPSTGDGWPGHVVERAARTAEAIAVRVRIALVASIERGGGDFAEDDALRVVADIVRLSLLEDRRDWVVLTVAERGGAYGDAQRAKFQEARAALENPVAREALGPVAVKALDVAVSALMSLLGDAA